MKVDVIDWETYFIVLAAELTLSKAGVIAWKTGHKLVADGDVIVLNAGVAVLVTDVTFKFSYISLKCSYFSLQWSYISHQYNYINLPCNELLAFQAVYASAF